jgi:hypothetical protein
MRKQANLFLNPHDEYCLPKITLEPIHVPEPKMLETKSEKQLPYEIRIWSSARNALKTILQNKMQSYKVSINTTTESNYLTGCFNNLFDNGFERSKGNSPKWDIFAADFGFTNSKISNASIIYDDAWSFSIDVANNFLKNGGLYYVSSIPKIIGLPQGAIVLTKDLKLQNDSSLSEDELKKLQNYFSWFLVNYDDFAIKRRENYEILMQLLGFEFFDFMKDFQTTYPGAGVFGTNRKFDEVKFKQLLNKKGIRGTSFFGNNAVILPIHQYLTRNDLEYIAEIVINTMQDCLINQES